MQLTIKPTDDFEITGDGQAPQWQNTDWVKLQRQGNGQSDYLTHFKTLWSKKGIYFLFECEDKKLTCTKTEDFDTIYEEDVVEVFLWTDESQRVYFEYEISPLNVELPILVANSETQGFFGWAPWQYEGERKIRKATVIRGGEKKSMAECEGWYCEFFIPFTLLRGMGNRKVKSGTKWRANMYRIDYDQDPSSQWVWAKTKGSFHDYKSFGTITFE